MKKIKLFPLKNPVDKDITIPSSKSYTNRALLISSLILQKVEIVNPLICSDSIALISCLNQLGIKIKRKKNSLEVLNDVSCCQDVKYHLDANLSGTTMRFILALATIVPGVKTLSGRESLNKRPVKGLVEGLRQLGAKTVYLKKEGYPPLMIKSSKLSPGKVVIDSRVSSQYISAILLIAPAIGKLEIELSTKPVSKPYIDMTIDIMGDFGVSVLKKSDKRYVVNGNQKYKATGYEVETDISSACYFLAIAALSKSTLNIKNINPSSIQADMEFIKILEKMGNKIAFGKNSLKIFGKNVSPVSVDMKNCPDQAQTLAVLASFANGESKISGLQSLHFKETDRIIALRRELIKMNIKTDYRKNTLTVYGKNPKGAPIATYQDHRMAMSFAVSGVKISDVEIEDFDVVEKTFPEFWDKLNEIGVKTEVLSARKSNIVLIGMRGSGKTTVAKKLSAKLGKKLLELDEMLTDQLNLSISQIVTLYGWKYFRDIESKLVKKASMHKDSIISTGGGVVLRSKNVKNLRKNGLVVLLSAPVDTLSQRAANNSDRPPLTSSKTLKQELEEVLKQRDKLYQSAADIVIDTDNKSVSQVTDEIIKICAANI